MAVKKAKKTLKTKFVFVEWRDRDSRYHGGNYSQAELLVLCKQLNAEGVWTICVNDKELSTENFKGPNAS